MLKPSVRPVPTQVILLWKGPPKLCIECHLVPLWASGVLCTCVDLTKPLVSCDLLWSTVTNQIAFDQQDSKSIPELLTPNGPLLVGAGFQIKSRCSKWTNIVWQTFAVLLVKHNVCRFGYCTNMCLTNIFCLWQAKNFFENFQKHSHVVANRQACLTSKVWNVFQTMFVRLAGALETSDAITLLNHKPIFTTSLTGG